jgi:hypothetical protein
LTRIAADVVPPLLADNLKRLAKALARFHPRLRDFPDPSLIQGQTCLGNNKKLNLLPELEGLPDAQKDE